MDWMLTVLRDPNQPAERRDEMAKAAAPYVHPKLSAIDATVRAELNAKVEAVGTIDLAALTDEERETMRGIVEAARSRRDAAAASA